MKKFILIALATVISLNVAAQQKEHNYEFTTVKENPITSIKNQFRSGTCWCYSTLSFLESEVIRIKGEDYKDLDLSDMFIVKNSYYERGIKYVYLDGCLRLAAGSSAEDVLHVIKDHGIIPESVYDGFNYGYKLAQQAEVDAVILGFCKAVVSVPGRGQNLSTAWKAGLKGIIDAYFGVAPEKFEYKGKKYTPENFRDALGIVPDDYISLTSFTHHPFYEQFVIEVCDNWRWDASYNLPINEFMAVIDNAIENGYTLAWGTDVSEKGFTRNGIALIVDPDADKKPKAGSDQEHWTGKAEEAPQKPLLEDTWEEVTQERRQIDFDRKDMTDDHGMQIYGIAQDQNGHKFYMVKNSWGETGAYKGIWYASETFVKAKTLNILVHKNAIPKEIRKKLGIK
ncbi:MAG: aminopeptidase [Bacteroidales bacterium]|nr:aminopeptidase [Bacteroidales bacterium]